MHSYIPSYICFGAFCYCDYTHYFFCLFFVTIHITIVTHKSTSEQIHHHCHTVLSALTLLAILPLQLHCSHTHKIIELMIASTPIEAFRRELLGKAKGYKLTDALSEGTRFEAILAGRQEIQKRTSTPLNNVDQVGQACGNCGRPHPPRACPAYKDSCTFCGKIGHWKKFCRKRKGTNRPKEDVQQRGDTKSDGKQHRDDAKGSRRRDRRFHDLEPVASYASEEDSTEPYDCIRISSVRYEVFTTLDVICPRKKGMRKITLKVDSGAEGNTLPLRTYKQMYKTLPFRTYKQMYKTFPQKTSLSPQGMSSWLPTTVRRSPI